MTRASKADRLRHLSLHIQACIRCPYASVRANPLTGDGEHRSPILIVGPIPRKRDDEDGEIFSGRAGKKLERMLKNAELNINQTYRTYLVRCYPGQQPEFGEFSAFKRCCDHTTRLLKIMQPTAVVMCGLKVFKWLVIRWTSEIVDDRSFYRSVGKAVRLKEVWGELKFFVIESPAVLSNARNPELELKSVELLAEMKRYVVARQKNEPMALSMVDLKRRTRFRDEQQTFDWS